jgi:hypothetical protein
MQIVPHLAMLGRAELMMTRPADGVAAFVSTRAASAERPASGIEIAFALLTATDER